MNCEAGRTWRGGRTSNDGGAGRDDSRTASGRRPGDQTADQAVAMADQAEVAG